MATLNFDYIDASIMPTIKAAVENQSMRSRPLLRKLKETQKVTGENPAVLPLSYGNSGNNIKWMSRGTPLNLTQVTVMGPASFTPALLAGTLTIWKEDELLLINNPGKIVDFTKTWAENLTESIDWKMAMRLHDHGTTATSPKEMSSLDDMVYKTTNTVGGLARSSYSWWLPKVINCSGSDFPDAGTEEGLLDPDGTGYIMDIIAAGYAKANRLKQQGVSDILASQYHFDMIEKILDPKKHGDLMGQQYGAWGFTSLKYRKAEIVVDEDLADALLDSNSERYSDGNDVDEDFTTITASSGADITALNGAGRIYFLNVPKGKDYLRFYVHPAANWTMDKWIPMANQAGTVKQMFIQCQLVTNCSATHCTAYNIYNKIKYGR